jgi:NTE family protein
VAETKIRSRLALMMSGGGARAAYQVGFLRCLARHRPDIELPILTGVSAGAINAAFLGNHRGPFSSAVEDLSALWLSLRAEEVFSIGALGLGSNALHWGLGLLTGGRVRPGRGLVDTSPLRRTLLHALHSHDGELDGIPENLRSGRLDAIAITASSYRTGRSVTFVQGTGIPYWERSHRRSRAAQLRLEHVEASAALPFLFPAVQVGDAWYGDGGMRLTAPFSPAIHLGSDRILAISTRYFQSEAEAEEPMSEGYPSTARVAGIVMNAIFLDQFDGDALRLERINRLVQDIPEDKRDGLRPVRALILRPSCDLGKLANDFEPRLPRTLRFFTRGLGTRDLRSNDLLSLIMFQPDYLQRLVHLGEEDAEDRRAELLAFVGPAPPAAPATDAP